MIKYLLDTNILIYTIKNRPSRVRTAFKAHSNQLAISTISLGELIYGVEKSTEPARNMADVEALVARLDVMPFDVDAALHFGQLRAELSKSGRLIGPYDLMIAGHARSRGLILVTNNLREFRRVPGLRVENWAR